MSSSSSGYSGSSGPSGLGGPGHMSTLGRQQHYQQQQQAQILPGTLNVVAVAGLGNPHPAGTGAFLPSSMVLPPEVGSAINNSVSAGSSASGNSSSGLTGGCGASRHIISSPIQVGSGPSKGLLNGPGQNNCFLNCAVQVSFSYSTTTTSGSIKKGHHRRSSQLVRDDDNAQYPTWLVGWLTTNQYWPLCSETSLMGPLR